MRDIPKSMRAELGRWNQGAGIDLEGWISCEGNFALAVGYTTLFWPKFILKDGMILMDDGDAEGGTCQTDDPAGVEALQNHLHLSHVQAQGCEDISGDKLRHFGRVLKEVYEAKLHW